MIHKVMQLKCLVNKFNHMLQVKGYRICVIF